MLFTVNKSPFEKESLKSCLKSADADTPVLLYEDGIYAAVPGTSLEPLMKDALRKFEIYALEEDLEARGIEKVLDGIIIINYSGFVDLVEKHNPVPWL